MYIRFSFSKKKSNRLCTGTDPDKVFEDQQLSLKARKEKPYWQVWQFVILGVVPSALTR